MLSQNFVCAVVSQRAIEEIAELFPPTFWSLVGEFPSFGGRNGLRESD